MKKVIVALVAGLIVLVMMGMAVVACSAYTKVCVQVNTELVTNQVNREWMEYMTSMEQTKRDEERDELIEYLNDLDYNTLLNEYAYTVYGAGWYIVVETYSFSFGEIASYNVCYMGEVVHENLLLGDRSALTDAIVMRKGY